jgi:nicotinamide-nucleotide adenylyltransferase
MSEDSWALFVGRFQPFHKGHSHAIHLILEREPKVVIAVGSSLSSHEERNPFTMGERVQMILGALAENSVERGRYLITGVPDTEFHPSWVTYVLKSVPPINRVYTNDPLTTTLFEEEGYEVVAIPLQDRSVYSGTEIRRRIVNREDWSDLVPGAVHDVIRGFHGDVRIRRISGNGFDKIQR